MPIFPKNTNFKMESPLLKKSRRKQAKENEKKRLAEYKANILSGMTSEEALANQNPNL
jgi:hypothetical protein